MDAQLTATYSRSFPLRLMVSFFAAALFTSAALLFWVQPVIAKMILPLLGGAPSVWNTCMVFFQALLLAGYAYALFISQRLQLKNQALLHIILMLGAGLFLPFAISQSMIGSLPTQSNPTLWLLGVLSLTVGFPFFVLSATAPLLQRWFSYSGHSSAKDPYFLYAVSNAGSMLSLLAFPFLLEPRLNLQEQSRYWAFGYLLLAVLICSCAILVGGKMATLRHARVEHESAVLTFKSRLEWVLLAFIPSSLMLGVTTYISTDVASVPLIWIVPLSLYLLTFILAFANKQLISLRVASIVLPALIVCLGFVVILRPAISVWVVIALHLAVFFLVGFICHRRIALTRPPVTDLAQYYLCISLGGVLGGIFNALLAPLLFSTPLEYPLIILAACLMRPPDTGRGSRVSPWMTIGFPALLLLLVAGLSLLVPRFALAQQFKDGLILGIPLAMGYLIASRRRFVFGLSLLAVMIGGYGYLSARENSLTTVRNFFGVWRVSSEDQDKIHRLQHGTTAHGWQFTDAERRCNATAYYHKDGPLGQVFAVHNAKPRSRSVAAIGLGAGTVASYSTSAQSWDFYEIDPAIVRLATDSRYFTFLSGCSAAPYRIILGDARLRLREAVAGNYSLVILDAFSSDSVPAHLLTVEALDLYLSKLAPDGIVAFHVSNRYLNLEPLLSGLASRIGAAALIREDTETNLPAGKYRSKWVVIARSKSDLGEIATDPRWRSAKGNVVWTDHFSNILDLMK
ncbi:MAG: fused MFS/spermidine synthase [Acidobacteriota bacterium]|nr:fused MFS/spermidine synthase [Acidobacteriota bacterium]